MGTNGGGNRLQIDISWRSLFRVLIVALLAYVLVLLWPLLQLLFIAILIAVALYPIVKWAVRHGWPRWVGLLLATALMLLVVLGIVGLLAPLVIKQAAALAENMPKIRDQVLTHLRAFGPVHDLVVHALDAGPVGDSQRLLGQALAVAKNTLGGLFDFALLLALAVYFMVDGPRAINWLTVFFPVDQRAKIARGLNEAARIICAYVLGQFITSALCSIYVFAVLSILHVPMALLVAIAAGIFDILPIIGFFLAVIPAMALGLTVSPATAVLVFVCYGAYHLFENYFIVPKVYGNTLRLSTLTVLIAIVAAAAVIGVLGAIAILPVVAAYPVIERLWLARKLEPDTVREHQ